MPELSELDLSKVPGDNSDSGEQVVEEGLPKSRSKKRFTPRSPHELPGLTGQIGRIAERASDESVVKRQKAVQFHRDDHVTNHMISPVITSRDSDSESSDFKEDDDDMSATINPFAGSNLSSKKAKRTWRSFRENFHISKITHPVSLLRRWWMRLVTVAVLYNVIVIPLRLNFKIKDLPTEGFLVMDYTTDAVLWLDILLHFFTLHSKAGILIRDFRATRREYLRGPFWFDFLASLPVDLGIWPAGTAHVAARLPRFLRIFRLPTYFATWESHSNFPNITRIVKLILSFGIISHWVACAFYAICLLEDFPLASTSEWYLSPVSLLSQRAPHNATAFDAYSRSLYWAITTMTGQGADTGSPSSNAQLWYTLLVVVIGLVVFAAVIGQIWTLISTLNEQQEHIRKKKDMVNNFMYTRRFPTRLKKRIRNYFDYLAAGASVDDEDILKDLPPHLRSECYLFLNRKVITAVPFFKGCPFGFVKQLAMKLRPSLFAPGDYIINVGDIGKEMFFISQGVVKILSSEGKFLARLAEGNFFGEVALLNDNAQRTASIVAETYVNAYILTKADLEEVLGDYPDVRRLMREIGVARIQKNEENLKKKEAEKRLRTIRRREASNPGSVRSERSHRSRDGSRATSPRPTEEATPSSLGRSTSSRRRRKTGGSKVIPMVSAEEK